MYKKLLTLSLTAAALCACSKDSDQQPLACGDTSVEQSVRSNIQEIIKQQAREFARKDSRQFVDADKLIAAGSQLEISLENAEETTEDNKKICRADLKVQIPSEIAATAENNSPLIYGDLGLNQFIERKIMGSNLSYNGGTFSTALSYTPNQNKEVTFEDNTLNTTAQIISSALLPYGVKSIVMIDGKAVSKEDALKMNRGGAFGEPPELKPEDILENNAASQEAGLSSLLEDTGSDAELLSPKTTEQETPSPAFSDLERAREQNRKADSEINRIWGGMDKTIQQGMLAEQRSWIQSKKQNCAQAAAEADNPAQAEYLRLQCDTRMTRERVQYLRGYTIN